MKNTSSEEKSHEDLGLDTIKGLIIPHICDISYFSTYTLLGAVFLHGKAHKSRQNSVNCHKADFATKTGRCADIWNSSKFGQI